MTAGGKKGDGIMRMGSFHALGMEKKKVVFKMNIGVYLPVELKWDKIYQILLFFVCFP